MKNSLKKIPTIKQRAKVYDILLWSKESISSDKLILYSQWVRFDSRLGEIIVNYIFEKFMKYNPLELRKFLTSSPWPQVFLVICEFSEHQMEIVKDSRLQEFKAWFEAVKFGFAKIEFQNFFIGLDQINPSQLQKKMKKSLRYYERWGFWGTENLIPSPKNKLPRSLIGKNLRIQVLTQLLSHKNKITVTDYIRALSGAVHPRQAERDLKDYPGIRKTGFTRSRFYFLKF